jgi:hypothetical protein
MTNHTAAGRPGAERATTIRALALAAALGLLLCFGGTAHANRFGPPWQSEVTADQVTVHAGPDRAAPAVGPLRKGDVVVVLEQKDEWTRLPAGWLPSADVREKFDPWIAEVTAPSVEVRAKPNGSSDVRRTAERGALLRVMGASPGLEGDDATWWATTEGYVPLDAIGRVDPQSEWARAWALPTAEDAAKGWWGEAAAEAWVRAGATRDAPIVGELRGGERVKVLAEEEGQAVGGDAKWLRIDGGRYAGARVHSSLIRRIDDPRPSAPPPGLEGGEAVIVVDRPAHTLTLFRDGKAQFATYVALGKAGKDTPTGDYSTFGKFRADDMTSASVPDAERPYDLPNAPFVQYYKDGGFAIHGTYWHDAFGTEESQGCVNLTWADAAYLFGQTTPALEGDQHERWSGDRQATRVVIAG